MANELLEEDSTPTPKGTCDKHEVYYKAITIDEVTMVVAKSLLCHTIDCPPFDKVTDPTDEVLLKARSLVLTALENTK